LSADVFIVELFIRTEEFECLPESVGDARVTADQHVKPPFEVVVAQHGGTVLRVVRAVVGHSDADDAWSDTFLAALKAYPQLPPDANVEAWLVTIAHRKAIDITRTASRRAVPVADPPDSPARERADTHDLDLDAALGALPPKQRQAVAYHYLAGLPYSKIALILDSSVAAARRAAADGIATLRRTYPLLDTTRKHQ
jgi:RNA polymerase sigma factor (sigma-70 family)